MTAMRLLLLSTALFGFAISSPLELKSVLDTGITPIADNDDVEYRLGRDVLPERYELTFTPYFANVSRIEIDSIDCQFMSIY